MASNPLVVTVGGQVSASVGTMPQADSSGNLTATGYDALVAGALPIGATTATGVTIGKAGVSTTLGAKLIVPAATSKTAGAAVAGTCALDTNGTVTVSTTSVTANSVIFVGRVLDGGTVGGLYVAKTADITAGTSFIIRSLVSSTAGAVTAATLDTSTVSWFIVN